MASTEQFRIRYVRQTAIIYTVVVFIGEPKIERGGGGGCREGDRDERTGRNRESIVHVAIQYSAYSIQCVQTQTNE